MLASLQKTFPFSMRRH